MSGTAVQEIEAPVPPEEVPEDVRALIGTRSEWWIAPEPIDRSFVRRFADAILDHSPLYRDEKVARDAGYSTIPGPPTSIVRYPHGGTAIAEPHQVFKDMVGVLVFGGRTHVHGGTRLKIFRPAQVGDQVAQRTRLKDVQMKTGRGGRRMGMTVRETVYVNQHRQVLAVAEQIEFELP